MVYGYARENFPDQLLSEQTDALRAYGCTHLVEEQGATGKERPALQELLAQMQAGDTLVVCKLDRLARSVKDLMALVRGFEQQGVHFVSLEDQLDTTSTRGRELFTVINVLTTLEQDLLRERATVGLAANSGTGRPKGLTTDALAKAQTAKNLYLKKQKTVAQISRLLGVGRATVYRYLAYLNIPTFRDNKKNK